MASAVAGPASEGIQADLRFLLADGNVGAAFIDTLEANGILSIQDFAGLERYRTHMRDVLSGAFGLLNSSVQDLTLLSRILHVWEVSNKRVAVRLLVASQYKAHGETLEMRQRDYLIYVEALNLAKGLVVADERPRVHDRGSTTAGPYLATVGVPVVLKRQAPNILTV